VFAALLTTILFSISAVCGHRSARLIGGTEANFWRITCATLLLSIWAFALGGAFQGTALPVFVLSGVVGIGLGDVALFQALPRLGPRLSMLIFHCLTAPLGGLIEWLWLGTPLTVAQILCGATILIGVAVALAPEDHQKRAPRIWLLGILAGTLGAIGQAGGAVLSRKAYQIVHLHGEHLSPFIAGFQRVLGGWFLAAIALWIVKRRNGRLELISADSPKRRKALFWIALNSLAGQTLGVTCMQWALEHTPAGIVLPIIAMAPIAVIPLTYTLDGDRPSLRSLAGGAIAVAGVIALTQYR